MGTDFQRLPGYCEDCGNIYLTNGLGFSESVNVTIKNAVIGTCPSCGGKIRLPDGVYDIMDGIINLTSDHDQEEIARMVKIFKNFRANITIKEVQEIVEHEFDDSKKIMEWIYELFEATGSLNLAMKFIVFLFGLGLSMGADEVHDYFTTSDVEANQMKIIKQNEEDEKRDNFIIQQNEKILQNQNEIKKSQLEQRMPHKERKSTIVSKKKKGKKK